MTLEKIPKFGEVKDWSNNNLVSSVNGNTGDVTIDLSETKVQSSEPTNPSIGDKWIDDSLKPWVLKTYLGSWGWRRITAVSTPPNIPTANVFDGDDTTSISGVLDSYAYPHHLTSSVDLTSTYQEVSGAWVRMSHTGDNPEGKVYIDSSRYGSNQVFPSDGWIKWDFQTTFEQIQRLGIGLTGGASTNRTYTVYEVHPIMTYELSDGTQWVPDGSLPP